jgi:hypothetical protein
VKLCPRFDKPTLRTGKIACDEFDGIEAEHTDMLLVVRMEVRRVVDGASFHEHADDDAEKPADLGHDGSFYDLIRPRGPGAHWPQIREWVFRQRRDCS